MAGTESCSSQEYRETNELVALRKEQYSYLDEHGHVYLDYAGAGLSARRQIQEHSNRMKSFTAGNPHSISPASTISTGWIETTRMKVLEFLNASPQEYTVIFTANATGAVRLIGEAYPFRRRSRLVLTADNHNSINGLRCFAKRSGSHVEYIPIISPELRTRSMDVISALSCSKALLFKNRHNRGLFAYPAQSNFTGVRHPLDWIKIARNNGYDVLLDAAAYLPTSRLDLSAVQPDFLVISWYKIFGFPTGVGCLVARRNALTKLSRPWFSGGTVDAALIGVPVHTLTPGAEAFEDGTVSFQTIPDVEFGIRWVQGIGIDTISEHVQDLTAVMINRLQGLYHGNQSQLITIYGPLTTENRGGTLAFNVVDAAGNLVDDRLVAKESTSAGISIRTGCFCNPGAGEAALDIRKSDIVRAAKVGGWYDKKSVVRLPHHPFRGALRVSFGLASVLADVEAFARFLETTYQDRVISKSDLECLGSL